MSEIAPAPAHVPSLPCARCGEPGAVVEGVVMCPRCRDLWADFLLAVKLASGIGRRIGGRARVRLPSGMLYTLRRDR